MQAIQLLKEEHAQAKAAFRAIATAPAAERRARWASLRPELELHEQKEEAHLYAPAAREVQGNRSLADWEGAHRREVQEAEGLIRSLDLLDPADEKWLRVFQRLRATLEEHIRQEEQDIWPRIEQVWSATRLDEAGRQMAAMARQAGAAAG